eukprot:TRINITY_DN33905_c0_g1_i1.p2 TRINITY_DN33905_c0_g1~~TRINITY_DN33905_c0_g1_i1.p2  ORF type:complete len:289 (-),score=41.02 TRINITY_DN33905_c0_g1_i1:312-1178(-)
MTANGASPSLFARAVSPQRAASMTNSRSRRRGLQPGKVPDAQRRGLDRQTCSWRWRRLQQSGNCASSGTMHPAEKLKAFQGDIERDGLPLAPARNEQPPSVLGRPPWGPGVDRSMGHGTAPWCPLPAPGHLAHSASSPQVGVGARTAGARPAGARTVGSRSQQSVAGSAEEVTLLRPSTAPAGGHGRRRSAQSDAAPGAGAQAPPLEQRRRRPHSASSSVGGASLLRSPASSAEFYVTPERIERRLQDLETFVGLRQTASRPPSAASQAPSAGLGSVLAALEKDRPKK